MNNENSRVEKAKSFIKQLAKIEISNDCEGYDFSCYKLPYFVFMDKEKIVKNKQHFYECNAFFISKENLNKFIIAEDSDNLIGMGWDYWDYVVVLDVDKNEIIKLSEEIK